MNSATLTALLVYVLGNAASGIALTHYAKGVIAARGRSEFSRWDIPVFVAFCVLSWVAVFSYLTHVAIQWEDLG